MNSQNSLCSYSRIVLVLSVVTAPCDGLANLLGAAQGFSCQPMSGVINFHASGLTVDPIQPGVIPNTLVRKNNDRI